MLRDHTKHNNYPLSIMCATHKSFSYTAETMGAGLRQILHLSFSRGRRCMLYYVEVSIGGTVSNTAERQTVSLSKWCSHQ